MKDFQPSGDGPNRRQFLQWASSVGLAAIAPDTVAEVASAKEKREKPDSTPESERGDPTSEVNLPHLLDQPKVQQNITRHDETSNPEVFYNRFLKEGLQNNPDKDTFKVVVGTVGERKTITTEGTYQRTIHGWKPTAGEISELSQFGSVGYTSSFNGTTVTIKGVERGDIPKIAERDFVLRLTWDAPIALDADNCGDGSGINVDTLRSNDYYWFRNIDGEYDISSDIRIGIIDTGYDATETAYASPHASDIGIDGSLAKDFTTDGDPNNDTYSQDECYSHGTNVADTTAYMLDSSACHSNLFVPLKIWSDSNRNDEQAASDNLRDAIEYAVQNDIEVINISSGMRNTTMLTNYCTEQFCNSLNSYAMADYIATATSGNAGHTDSVQQPGGSWLTIGTGGINQNRCSNADYQRDGSSCYAPSYDYTTCNYCENYASSGSSPTVYGSYHTETDAGKVISGTSFAAPAAATCAAVMQANGIFNFSYARGHYEDMNMHTICPDEAAKDGELLDGYEAHYSTN